MKTCFIGSVILIVMTLVGSMLGTSDDIIAPVVGSAVTSFIFLGLIQWERKNASD